MDYTSKIPFPVWEHITEFLPVNDALWLTDVFEDNDPLLAEHIFDSVEYRANCGFIEPEFEEFDYCTPRSSDE